MKILQVIKTKQVRKTEEEIKRELDNCMSDWQKELIGKYKEVPTKEPTYIVEMSAKELRLVNFYLELERRKPIVNVEVEAKLKKRGNKK